MTSGNGSVRSAGQPYDHSDAVLELTPGMQLVQFFAPRSWAADNAADLDFSAVPALLPGGQVVAACKAQIAWLLDGRRLGGIGGQQASLGQVCASNVDGGVAVSGRGVYPPCLTGIVAIRATSSRALHWVGAGTGGGRRSRRGLVWTIGRERRAVRARPGPRAIRQRADRPPGQPRPCRWVRGPLLAANARRVVAFLVTGHWVPPADASPADGASPPGGGPAGWAGADHRAAVVECWPSAGVYLGRRRRGAGPAR